MPPNVKRRFYSTEVKPLRHIGLSVFYYQLQGVKEVKKNWYIVMVTLLALALIIVAGCSGASDVDDFTKGFM